MKLLSSSKINLPIVYLVEDLEELKTLPFGIPYIINDIKEYENVVKMLEFEVLYQSALATKLPFRWKNILKDLQFTTSTIFKTKVYKVSDTEEIIADSLEEYIHSLNYVVDIEYLKNLHIIPSWFSDIETAIKHNITSSILYNPSLYNKKLDLCIGAAELSSPERNLIIIDISGSIPKDISKAILLLSKTMATSFFSDLLITGSKSTLYDYTEIDKLNVSTIYNENETDNDQIHFLKLISTYRKYNTVIGFGDNDYSGQIWRNIFNKGTRSISVDEGKTLNKWSVNQIMNFHTKENTTLMGYVRWFDCENVTHAKNWVKYIGN